MSDSKPIYWFTGNFTDVRFAISKVLEKYSKAAVRVCECEAVPKSDQGTVGHSAADVIRALKGRDIQKKSKVVRVRGLPEDYKIIEPYLNLVNESNVLLIDGPVGYYTAGKSRRLITAKNSKFFKTIKKEGVFRDYGDEANSESEAAKWIAKVAKRLNSSIERQAASRLTELRGLSYDLLYSELLRLVDYADGTIKLEDVEACVLPSFREEVWTLIDHLDKQDYYSSVEHLRHLFATLEAGVASGFYGGVLSLLGALQYHYGLLVAIKDVSNRADITDLAKEVSQSVFKKTTSDGEAKWDKQAFDERAVKFALRKPSTKKAAAWSKGKLYGIMEELDYCRFACRYNSSQPVAIQIALDNLVGLICGKMASKQAVELRPHFGSKWLGRPQEWRG